MIIICKTCKQKKPYYKGRLCHPCYKEYAKKWRHYNGLGRKLPKKCNSTNPSYIKRWRKLRHKIANDKCKDSDPAFWTTKIIIARYGTRCEPWPGDLEKMEVIYKRSRELTKKTGIKHSVDHIIPLNSPTVSGLHVSWNLQVLTLRDNKSKGNRYDSIPKS